MPSSALVGDRDLQAAGEERRLAQALLERGELQARGALEDVGVGQERDDRPRLRRRLAALELALRRAADVVLRPDVAVAADLDVELLRQRVDHRHADAVQAAGHLVAAAVAELAAGVQHGEDDLDGRQALLLHDRHRDAAAVVTHGDRAVGVDRHIDRIAVARQGLVDGVVDDLVDEVMQPTVARGPDVHARALPDGLQTLEDGDVLGVVAARGAGAVGGGIVASQSASERQYAPAPRGGGSPGRTKSRCEHSSRHRASRACSQRAESAAKEHKTRVASITVSPGSRSRAARAPARGRDGR